MDKIGVFLFFAAPVVLVLLVPKEHEIWKMSRLYPDGGKRVFGRMPGGLISTAWIIVAGTLAMGQVLAAEPPEKGKKVFRAGAATSNITPWLGEGIIGGWGAPPAEHIHEELHARCLVLDDGSTRIALVVADSEAVSREVFDAAKRMIREHTGLPENRMLMAASHTHSATSSRPRNVLLPGEALNEYQRFLAHRIADGVRCAINNLEPARIGWGMVDVPEHVHNRRWLMKAGAHLMNPFGGKDKVQMNPRSGSPDLIEPAGPIDPQVCFVSVQSAEGRPIALVANYSLHYVGGAGPGHISGDYFAMFADRIQQLVGADRLDPPFVGVMSNGTSGDINNKNFRIKIRMPRERKEPYEQMRLVAHDVAQKVFAVYQKLQYRDWVPLRMGQREVSLRVRKPTPEQLARARELVAGASPIAERPHEQIYAKRVLQQEEAPAEIKVVLQALRVGEVGITAIPFEVFVEIGLELKAESPLQPTFTIELANGGYGYLPTPEQHALGGYETWLGTSKVEIEASTKIVKNLLEMLDELKPAAPSSAQQSRSGIVGVCVDSRGSAHLDALGREELAEAVAEAVRAKRGECRKATQARD